MDDLGATENVTNGINNLDIHELHAYISECHHRTLRVISDSIKEEKTIPASGMTLIHFDAHPDELVPEDMQIRVILESKADKDRLFSNFACEAWIKEAVLEGYFNHVIWIKPPWSIQVEDSHRMVRVGQTESDPGWEVSLDIKTLGRSIYENTPDDFDGFQSLFNKYLRPETPFVLDFDLNFFSTDNPFTSDYPLAGFFARLKDLFEIKRPVSNNSEDIERAIDDRVTQMEELKSILMYLHEHRTLPPVEGEPSPNYLKIAELKEELLKFYKDDEIEWQTMYSSGAACNSLQMPVHHSKREDIEKMIKECISKILDMLPSRPRLITGAISLDYDCFTPRDDVDFILEKLLDLFKEKYKLPCFDYSYYE